MQCPSCQYELTRSVEGGGVLLRGNAPIFRMGKRGLTVVQRCPKCRRNVRQVLLALKVGTTDETDPRQE